MHIETLTFSDWGKALPATGFEWSHTPETLRVLDRHAKDVCLYGGYKGQQLVGLLPAVVRTELFATAIISPPPGFGIPQMGPILMPTSPKQRKREIVNKEFTQAILETVAAHDPCTLFGVSCSTTYTDPRPYLWAGFDVESRFTYQLALRSTTPKRVLQSFSREARRGVHNAEEAGITVSQGGIEDARAVYDAHRTRRNEQGDNYPVSWEYTRDLVETLGDRIRVYVAETAAGAFLSGITVVYSNDKGYFFQGGTRTERNGNANELLHWRIIEDILTDPELGSIDRYDLGNANLEPLAHYKSKYDAEPVPHYLIKSGKLMDIVQKAYEIIAY
ncbi:GNAT family N-acetyltransferase [Halocatena pleomorpha]|uniref:GNAT family N-acetyltransferase n=1 Tax=Halocatena pleomorpha TaxID=1785090 RepID=A0A3P3RH90_9EURY|nr:GNAT family N-acetyltransferase [Halocatena pleomorpha]RRJ31823.1 GNAT family N-acetyltransferase [Halocatena pleomorpha]